MTDTSTTEGSIWKQLLRLFFPILLGTFFQQLYTTVDTVIVGHFLGKEALAAVGGGAALIVNLLVGFFVGLSSGATVIISQFFGAGDGNRMRRAISTALGLSVAGGLVLMVLGFLSARWMLEVIGTPLELMDISLDYILWYYTGLVPSLVYNVGSGIFRAVGDTRRPLYFLIVACISNIVFDLLMINVLGWGVAGVAIATVLSQVLSMVFVLQGLSRRREVFGSDWYRLLLDGPLLKAIVKVGLPAGFQAVLYSLSNLIIQAKINGFGTDTIAAFSAYSKLDSFYWMIIGAFGVAITVFSGQNFGAKKFHRVHQGTWMCLFMAAVSTVLMCAFLMVAARWLYGFFTSDQQVVAIGLKMLHFLVPFYITYISIEVLSGAIRGTGDSLVPSLMTLGGICLLRVLWSILVVPRHHQINTVLASYPVTWTMTSALFFFYYKFGRWRRRLVVPELENKGKDYMSSKDKPL